MKQIPIKHSTKSRHVILLNIGDKKQLSRGILRELLQKIGLKVESLKERNLLTKEIWDLIYEMVAMVVTFFV